MQNGILWWRGVNTIPETGATLYYEDWQTTSYTVLHVDLDSDGYFTPDDCNDEDPEINSGVIEICDGLDNNCNTLIDDFCVIDSDSDGIPDTYDPDDDNDNLLDVDEIVEKTDPLNPDTDGDGLLDGIDSAPLEVFANIYEASIVNEFLPDTTGHSVVQRSVLHVAIHGMQMDQGGGTTLGSMTVSVNGPNGFQYSFSDTDLKPNNINLVLSRDYPALDSGLYWFTVMDREGNVASRADLQVPFAAVPLVDKDTIQTLANPPTERCW